MTFRNAARRYGAVIVGLGGLVVSEVSLAAAQAAIDVTEVTTGLSNQVTPMTAIFTAIMGLAVVGAAFSWVRRALGK